MIRLEEIIPGSRIRGISGDEFVDVIAARSFGPDAVEVTYKSNSGVEQTVLFRSSEAELELAEAARRFGFDGDGHLCSRTVKVAQADSQVGSNANGSQGRVSASRGQCALP